MAQIWTPGGGSSGLSLELAGATQPTRYVGATAGGAPVSGTFQQGDFVIDNTGNVYICTVAGSPGTWGTIAGGVTAVLAGTNCTIGGTAQQPVVNFAQNDPLVPTGWWAENFPRFPGVSSQAIGAFTSGSITYFAVTLLQGQILSKIAMWSGNIAGAASAGAHNWFGLYDNNLTPLCLTADDTSLTWAVQTQKSLNINWKIVGGAWSGGSNTTFTLTYSGIYYIAIVTVMNTTMPNLMGSGGIPFLLNMAPQASGVATQTGQTTPNASPTTALTASATAIGNIPYIQLG